MDLFVSEESVYLKSTLTQFDIFLAANLEENTNRNEKRKSFELSESEEDEELCFTKGMACKTQGTSQSKIHTQRTCEDPYVEADEKSALCFFKAIEKERNPYALQRVADTGRRHANG